MFRRPLILLASILCTLHGGWLEAGEAVPLDQSEVESAVSENAVVQEAIREIERTVPVHDPTVFDHFLRSDWLLGHVTQPVADLGLGATAEVEAAFFTGTVTSWKSRGLSADYLGEQFRFLRAHSLAGRSGLLFRAAGEKGRLNYCLLTLARDSDGGAISADDIYVVGVGEFVSDTLRRGYLMLVESMNPVSPSGQRAALYVRHLQEIMSINQALAAKNYKTVLSLAEALPVTLRRERSLLLMRLEAAEHSSMSEHARVFAEWRTLHPDVTALPLKSADYFIACGEFTAADQVLSRLNERLGGDAYLLLRMGEARMLQRHVRRLQTAGSPAAGPAGAEASANLGR